MAKRKSGAKGDTLEQRVKYAVVRTWDYIRVDVDWPVTLAEAAELCLDADRPVEHGGLTRADYRALCDTVDSAVQDRWAMEALREYF